MPRFAGYAVFLVVTGSLPATAADPASDKASLSLVAAQPAFPRDTTAEIAATVRIEPEWHINSHRPTFDYLIPTEIRLELPNGWAGPELRYPDGEMKAFAFAGNQPLSVYEGEALVSARFLVPGTAVEGSIPIRGQLRYQACNDRVCLPPATTYATSAITIDQLAEPIEAGSLGTPDKGLWRRVAALTILGLVAFAIGRAMLRTRRRDS